MKFSIAICYFFFAILTFSQEEKENHTYIQTTYFYGNILKHNDRVGHFLVDHPTGFILSYNKKTTGKRAWEHRYNYPDIGISIAYQDYKNAILGELYSVYGHYNFYMLPRANKNQLIFRIGWGIAYNTNPYDKVSNPKNLAFGTKLNSSTYLKLYYQRENIIGKIGINAGLNIIHASNSSIKSPNTGINVLAASIGLSYNLNNNDKLHFLPSKEIKKFKQPIKYNFEFRFGVNESDFIASGVKPFFVLSAYADKRLNRKSAIQFGSELMVNYSLKDYIDISAISNPDFERGDFKRVGVFVGHELFISKISMIAQLGYYIYYPIEFEGVVYGRLGLKYYFNEKWFTSVSLKAHGAKAETVAFGIGIRI
ncbi:MAG: acyloxyacyl hydrolase [Flavobacteriaceae bacterium]|nr:acyloxyacyl hydrolase [Flavobacteriaceae bacterium]